jgi:hypothetical protein
MVLDDEAQTALTIGMREGSDAVVVDQSRWKPPPPGSRQEAPTACKRPEFQRLQPE